VSQPIVAPATNRPPTWRIWLLAARPATLAASVVPVVVGTAAATPLARVTLPVFAAALLASVAIQVGTNFANDVADFRRGADTTERLGPTRVTQSGLASPRQVLVATYLVFALAALLGSYLVAVGGWPILVAGALAIVAGVTYTSGPWPFGYHALGDVVCFLFFGMLGVLGSGYLQTLTLTLTPRATLASLSVGCLVTAILVVNNLRDIPTDRLVGKRTLAVLLGPRGTRVEFVALVVGAYLVPPVMWVLGQGGLALWLPWLTLPLAVRLLRRVASAHGRGLNAALRETGQLHLLFGLLFAAGLFVPR